MINTICKMLDISRPTYFRYQKKKVPIIKLLQTYFTQKELEDFTNSGRLEKLDNLEFIYQITIHNIESNFFEKLSVDEYEFLKRFAGEIWVGNGFNDAIKPIENFEYNNGLFIRVFKEYLSKVSKPNMISIMQNFQNLSIVEKFFFIKNKLCEISDVQIPSLKKDIKVSILEDDPQQAAFIKESISIAFDDINVNIFTKEEDIKRYSFKGEDLVIIDYYLTAAYWTGEEDEKKKDAQKLIETLSQKNVQVIVMSGDDRVKIKVKDFEKVVFLQKGSQDFSTTILNTISKIIDS